MIGRGLLVATALSLLLGCQKGPCACDCPAAVASSAPAASAPVATAPAPAVAPAPDTQSAQKASELVLSANRRMMHEDGQGCLTDLDQVRVLDATLESHLAILRGQCEMLIGSCQPGKERVAAYYVTEMALSRERAERMAESIASMRCRSGDSSERDRFLRAAQELTEGAYIEQKPAAFCKERIATLRELGPRIPARDVDDGAVTGTKQALFYTAAACYARAGDCSQAYAIYAELFPKQGFAASVDAATRAGVIRSSFDSSIERCRK